MEPLAEVSGEASVARGSAVGNGWGGVFQPFFETAAAGDEVATSVSADLVEGGGGGFDGEELVAEEQSGGGGAGGAGDLPSFGDVGGGRGAGFCGGFAGVAEVEGAVDAVFDGDDALGGEADAAKDGELEGGAEVADDAESVQGGGGVEGVAGGVSHDRGSLAEREVEIKYIFKCFHTKSWHVRGWGARGAVGAAGAVLLAGWGGMWCNRGDLPKE